MVAAPRGSRRDVQEWDVVCRGASSAGLRWRRFTPGTRVAEKWVMAMGNDRQSHLTRFHESIKPHAILRSFAFNEAASTLADGDVGNIHDDVFHSNPRRMRPWLTLSNRVFHSHPLLLTEGWLHANTAMHSHIAPSLVHFHLL